MDIINLSEYELCARLPDVGTGIGARCAGGDLARVDP
jgi:hypothetical protein